MYPSQNCFWDEGAFSIAGRVKKVGNDGRSLIALHVGACTTIYTGSSSVGGSVHMDLSRFNTFLLKLDPVAQSPMIE